MAGSFSVTVSVVDKATRTIHGINKAFGSVAKPLTELKTVASDLSEAFGGILKPINLLTGSAGIAGIATFAYMWARAGTEVLHASERIGISTDNLQLLQGAAKLTGVSAESLTGGLKGLGDTLQDALYGRNQQALVILGRLGIHISRTADGAVDANKAFLDLADAIAKIPNPQVQAVIARAFGIEEMLPMLRKGSEGVKELEEAVRRSGAVMSPEATQKADHLRASLVELGGAASGVGNIVAEKYAPALDSATQAVTRWIEAHKQGSATLAQVGGGTLLAGSIAALSTVPGVGALLAAIGLGVPTAVGVGVGTAAGATAASLMEGNRGLSSGMTLDPEGGLVIMPPMNSAPQTGKVSIEIRTPPGMTARPTWEGSLIDDVKVESSMPVGPP